MVAKKVYFVVGTNTGVGKTVVTSLITRHLRDRGVDVMAVKPFCSGGRDDARRIREALGTTVSLDAINPWHFRVALTPLLAARREGVRLDLSECVRFLEDARRRCEVLLIEGAGGLLSPLGEGFDARDLIVKTKAVPLVVCPNQLGAINQVRLVLAALPKRIADRSRVVLINPTKRSTVTNGNIEILREMVSDRKIVSFPRVKWPDILGAGRLPKNVSETIDALLS